MEKIKVLGFLSTTKPVENYLEHILFHVHLLLVSLYLSLEHLIQVFWIRWWWSRRKFLVIQLDNSYDSEIYKLINALLMLKYSYKVQLNKGFKNRTQLSNLLKPKWNTTSGFWAIIKMKLTTQKLSAYRQIKEVRLQYL